MHNVALVPDRFAHYRYPVFKLLSDDSINCFRLVIFADSEEKKQRVTLVDHSFCDMDIENGGIRWININDFYCKGVCFWQKGLLRLAFDPKFDTIVYWGEAHRVSTWLSALIARLRKKKIIFWGHGIYGNESKLKLFIRKTFYRLAHKHLLYERRVKKLMVANGFKPENLYVVFNSLDYSLHKSLLKKYSKLTRKEVYPFFKNPELPVLVFIGRLTSVKRLDLLLHAVNIINSEKIAVNLLFIGDGPIRASLEKLGQKGMFDSCLHFVGACYSEEKNGKYLFFADLCVSPGNVGLTSVHSLSFGTPVCTHGNFNNQGPEAEAIIEGYNGFFFKEGDLDDLVQGINTWFMKNPDREQVRRQCMEIIDTYYNPKCQLSVFDRMVNNAKPEI